MTWGEFRKLVTNLLAADARRGPLSAVIDQQVRAALLDLQQHIEGLQQGHITVFTADELEREGQVSVGVLPEGSLPKRFTFNTVGSYCTQRVLKQVDWQDRNRMACCVGPLYQVALSRAERHFWVNPAITPDSTLTLEWNGRKRRWSDSDIVQYDEQVAEAVAYYVNAYIALKVNHDQTEHRLYREQFMLSRKNLYLIDQESHRLPEARNNDCVSSCAVTSTTTGSSVEFVAFGDSGDADDPTNTIRVAEMAMVFQPEFIIHLGDASYPDASPEYLHQNVSAHFRSYFSKWYQVMGNHDLDASDDAAALWALFPHLNDLNEGAFNYKFSQGEADFFVINTGDGDDPDLTGDAQWTWLEEQIGLSTKQWKIVLMHKPPYSSESTKTPGYTSAREDFEAMGADMVISGHAHNYERIMLGSFPYIIAGTGGKSLRGFDGSPVTGSKVRYSSKYGVLRGSITNRRLQIVFYSVDGEVIDNFALEKAAST